MHLLSLPVVLLSLSTITTALLVVPTSPQCASTCGNVLDTTSGSEMTCNDASYATSAYGSTFKACIACELNSTYFDPVTRMSDLHWAIYNMRFALSWCLFGWENNTAIASTPCLTKFSCGPLESAFEFDSLSLNSSSYSYCPLMDPVSAPKCSACLHEMGNENFLANFVTVLEAACSQQPVSGSQVSIQGSPFSSQTVNITTPTNSSSSSAHASASSTLSLGAKIGIAVGAIVAALAMTGFCIVWNGKRRRRRVLAAKARESGYEWQAPRGGMQQNASNPYFPAPPNNFGHPQSATGSQVPFFDSPQSQRPLYTNAWGQIINTDESPISAASYTGPEHSQHLGSAGGYSSNIGGGGGDFQKAYFSPYSSTYTSPVSATDLPKKIDLNNWPRDKKAVVEPEDERSERIEMVAHIGQGEEGYPVDKKDSGNFGIEPITATGERDRGRERWVGNEVPVLSHPGHGRGQPVQGAGAVNQQVQYSHEDQDERRTAGHQRSRSKLLTEDDARRGSAI